ncbi:hypothetical protein Q6315_12315 [Klebsiella pneumoniae]|uniref:hypothetical protein n=1 Tax=Klebsiella pneumoniae TaxID=573 RepID=UPI0027307DD5|nr:hypothetical protein [Klebsiella pneumoniae]MDP0955794.1 hypothetical protein [Klebsiella pneumoniae]MDP0961607.1 hypothetical protein [Klebsiella pneumoniae]MDP1041971.1 hypothetical protein [Klebsiella pneumoniae]MDP1311865.1 hypothetical protein [Klebsiella pneumoniae]MDP1320828.1 hypothetical protein [Klebsiella pneumoniae]
MKERGMIFNGEMVRALLSGRKTQTRRIVKGTDGAVKFCKEWDINGKEVFVVLGEKDHTGMNPVLGAISCPFGAVGDRIWVRETWATLGNEDGCCIDWEDNLCKGDERSAARIYRASCEQRPGDYGLWSIPDDAYWKPHTKEHKFEGAWRPSIHMPRWASRILLEITDVRVERLKSISDGDAIREGCSTADMMSGDCVADVFARLWVSIYGSDSWNANPWVWVIEFKRVEGGAA